MINWKVRAKNPCFWVQIGTAIIATIIGYAGISGSDVTTWGRLFDLIKMALLNPYCLVLICVAVWNAVNDPTTRGIGDSKDALEYDAPRKKEGGKNE